MLRSLILLLFLFICGCATQENYEKYLRPWIGKSETELISSFGPPTRFYENEDRRYLTWDLSTTYTTPVSSRTQYYNNAYTGYGSSSTTFSGGYTYSYGCTTTAIIKDKVVIGWQYKGNACKM